MRVADFAFDFCFWRQGCNGVDDNYVYCARARQCVTDFQCLLTGIRLGAEQVVDINTQFTCVDRIQRMLSIDKGTSFALALCSSHNL